MWLVDSLEALDVAVFRWINRDWSHPGLDFVMRFLSGNPFFVPTLIGVAVLLVSRGGARGRVFVITLALAAAIANGLVADPLKRTVRRQRPFAVLSDAILRVGRGNPLGSMPSAHAMNCTLMATLAGWYYRRSLWIGVPVAAGVALSRVYNGVHFPTDILAGAALGAGSGGLVLAVAERAWVRFGPRCLPGIAARLPSVLRPEWRVSDPGPSADPGERVE